MHLKAGAELSIRFKLKVLKYAKYIDFTETCREFRIYSCKCRQRVSRVGEYRIIHRHFRYVAGDWSSLLANKKSIPSKPIARIKETAGLTHQAMNTGHDEFLEHLVHFFRGVAHIFIEPPAEQH